MREKQNNHDPEIDEIISEIDRMNAESEELCEKLGSVIEAVKEANRNEKSCPATGRNFDITREGEALILKKDKEKGSVNLSKLLPDGVSFVPGEIFAYDKTKKGHVVYYPEEQIDTRGFMLAIFHELGHAALEMTPDYRTDLSSLKYLLAIKDSIVNLIKSLKIERVTKERKGKTKKVFHLTTEKEFEELLPAWFIEEEQALEEKNERDAWAFALRQLRKLDRGGYNVFAGFSNNKEIQAALAVILATYELSHGMSNLSLSAKEASRSLGEG